MFFFLSPKNKKTENPNHALGQNPVNVEIRY